MTDLAVAKKITEQIGRKALFMIGADNLSATDNGLSFRIKASKKVSHVAISLELDDTYTMTFYNTRSKKNPVVDVLRNVYFDMLNDLIASVCNVSVRL